jgi:hypothetical protein
MNEITDSGLEVVRYDLRNAFGAIGANTAYSRGTNTEGDVLTQTIDGRDLNEVWNDFQASLSAWNIGRSALVSALTFPVGTPVEDVAQLAMEDFEEASEFGEPKGIGGGDFFSMGYDFKWYDIATRFTWKFLAEAGASQVESVHNQVLEADNRLVFNKVMKSIFSNVNRTADIRGNAYNVYAFYNNDGTTPPAYKADTFSSTHDHFLVSGGAAVVSADLDDMEEHLVHHGYGRQAGATMILMVNRAQLAVIRSFRVSTGASYDFIAGAGQAPWLLPTNTGGVVVPQGGAVPANINGLPVAGVYGPWLVVEESYVPAGYMVGFATGGELAATNPIGMREHQNAALRGLRLVKGKEADYPLIDSFYNRGFGTGIRHRGAGVVMQVKASGSYEIPASYA